MSIDSWFDYQPRCTPIVLYLTNENFIVELPKSEALEFFGELETYYVAALSIEKETGKSQTAMLIEMEYL